MREIKFRAWVLGKMYEVKNLEWDWGHLTITTDGGWIALPDPEAHLMEFTGLRDKNGVEIYEGDVVQKLGLDAGVGVVKYDPEQMKFVFDLISGFDWAFYMPDGDNWASDEIVVIGNIHENPELLESPDA